MPINVPKFAPTPTTQSDGALGAWLSALSNYLQKYQAVEQIAILTASNSPTLQQFNLSPNYHSYLFEFTNLVMAANPASLCFQISIDNSTWIAGTAYRYAYSTALANATASNHGSISAANIVIDDGIGGSGGFGVSGEVKLYNPGDTTTHKYMTFTDSREDNGGNFRASTGGGVYTGTAAIQAINFFPSTGNFTSGTIKVYGFLI